MIYFTGDIHGGVERFYPYSFNEQKTLTKNDYMVICGDFGLIWDCEGTNPFEEEKLDYLENRSYTTLFVDGNHECYDRLNKYPIEEWHGGLVQKIRPSVIHLMRGQIYDIDGASILAFGGAESHDISDGILDQNDYKTEADFMDEYMKMRNTGKMFRVNHVSWWEEELPTDEEIALAKENLAKHNNKVDYIVTHDTSSRILHKMYDNCGGCTPNKLNNFFDWIENNIEYKHWFFGHHHINKDLDKKTTCLYYSIVFERIEKMKNQFVWNPLYNIIMDLKKQYIKENNIIDFANTYKAYNKVNKENNFINYMCNNVSNSEKYLNIVMPLIIKENNGCFLFQYDEYNMQRKAEELGNKPFFDLYDGLYRYCRSTVIDLINDELVIAPFKKFFNINQLEECSYEHVSALCDKAIKNNKSVEFSNKLDGSMMCCRFYNDTYFMSSSLSIDKNNSWRLDDGYNMLVSNKNLMHMIRNNPTKTHIFEYISLKDPHIVKYDKSQEGLYLIGLVDNYTGRESSYKDIIDYANKYNVLTTCVYDKNIHTILDELNNKQSDEAEGFVINIDGEKFKLKYNDYVKMHRVLSAISSPNLTIEMIADDKFDDYISKVPFMYREQIFKIANNVFKYIDNVNEYVNLCYASIPNYILENRGKACKYITDTFDNKYNCLIIRKYLDKPYNVLKNKNNSILNYTQILNKNEYVSNLLNEMKDKEVIHEL